MAGGDRWWRLLELHTNWLAGGDAEPGGSVRSVPACQGEALIIRFVHPCGRAGAGKRSEGPELRLSPIMAGRGKRGRNTGAGELSEEWKEQREEEEQLVLRNWKKSFAKGGFFKVDHRMSRLSGQIQANSQQDLTFLTAAAAAAVTPGRTSKIGPAAATDQDEDWMFL